MLNVTATSLAHRAAQRGAVLFITLIVLVAMTLAAIALVRSVDTTTLVAGNLAFHQSTTHYGDKGIESAITWMTAAGTDLTVDGQGYIAAGADTTASPTVNPRLDGQNGYAGPPQVESWDHYWSYLAGSNKVRSLGVDASGNTVSYVIHRLCLNAGIATGASCTPTPPLTAGQGSSKSAGNIALNYSSQVYYRITVRVDGPKNTVSYVQSIIAL
jgi:Tfp pilus assembly protein PilX